MANPNDLNLIPNVTEVYIASDGTILDTVGTSIFHAQSNYANLLSVYIEDGTASDTTTLINFTPTNSFSGKVPTYTSHWFFMSTEGIVQKTIDGITRSFVHFYVKVPNIVLRYNSGSQQVQNTVTVIQRYGSNYIGDFATVAALELANPAEENENNLATAYVLEDNGFFQVSDGEWVEVQQINAALQTKQYNTFNINVQAGLSSTLDVTPIETLAAQMIMNAVANVEAQFVNINSAIINNANDIDDLEMRMDTAEDDIVALETDRLLKDGSNSDNDITIRDVTFNLDVDTDVIQQTDLASFAEEGKTNLNAYIDSVQEQLDDKLSEEALLENFYNKTQTDALLDEKAELVHTHIESDITDLDKYSTSEADVKFMAKETYVDINDKILLSKLPDTAKQQTYVVTTIQDLPTENLIVGEKAYVTTDGDSYIWDGTVWLVLSQADWENVSLDWANITNAPKANGDVSLSNGVVYNKSQTDTLLTLKSDVAHTHTEIEIINLDKYSQAQVNTLLDGKSDVGHTHTESEITDLDKYTQNEVDTLLSDKSDVGHTHVEADITDLDKYTQTQTNDLLNNKVDKNITSYTEVTEFNDQDTYYVYQDGEKKVNLANLKSYLTSELEGITFQIVTADVNGLPDVQNPLTNTIYLIPSDNDEPDVHFEYLWIGNDWEYLGSTDVDLSNYYNKEQTDVLLNGKADISLLSSNITLFPTNANSDIPGYFRMVTSIDDEDFNTTAVNIPTGTITTNNQLLASLVADAGLFEGNPGIMNVPTIGNIRKVGGNLFQYAEFYFEIYQRNQAGTETLIGTSDTTGAVRPTDSEYFEFSAYALLNNGTFSATDRIVIKYYANLAGNSGSSYEFQFGGDKPVRTLLPVPVSVLVSNEAEAVIYDNSTSELDAANVQSAIDEVVVDLNAHVDSDNNPHSVTATQVGLGNVLNYAIASQAEAETGTSNDKYMTPLRTTQAISDSVIDGGTF